MNKEKNVGVSPLLGVPNGKLGFIIKDGSITIKKLATEVLNLIYNSDGGQSGGIIRLIDLSDRMTEENDTVTDIEIKTSLFLYNVYDRVSGIARVVEPKTEKRYALFKVCCYNQEENKILYVAYTTEDDFATGATWHFDRIIYAEDSLYPWAMSVFGDAVIDVENNLLNIGPVQYELNRFAGQDVITYSFAAPVITKFEYPKVNANGGTVYPVLEFEQDITKITTNAAGSINEIFVLKGTFNGNSFDYNDYSYATLRGNGAVPSFTGNNPGSGNIIDNTGKVELDPSTSINEISRRTVVASITVNERTSAEETALVYQKCALIGEALTIDDVQAGGVSKQIVEFSKTYGVIVRPADISTESTWITIEAKTITDDNISIKYSIAANTSSEERRGVITVGSNIDGVSTSVTFKQKASQAEIAVSKSSVAFNNKTVGNEYSEDIVVTGSNLAEDIFVTLNNGNRGFSVTPRTISKESAMSVRGAVLTIKYNPSAAGSTSDTVTLTSGGAEATIVLSGSASLASGITVNKSSVKFNKDSMGTYTDNSLVVTGTNLSSKIELDITGAGADRFSVSPTEISASDAANGRNVTITYSPVEANVKSTATLYLRSGSISTTVALEGKVSESSSAETGYYGAGSAIPTSLNSAYGTFDITDGTEQKINYTQVTGTYMYVILPSSMNADVTCHDDDNDTFTVRSDNSAISGYVVYYVKGKFEFQQNLTFTINLE